MIILEDVVYGAVELYCIILSIILSTPFISMRVDQIIETT